MNKKRKYYPLLPNQVDVYLDQEENPNTTIYNVPIIFEFNNSIDINKLRNAIVKTFNTYSYVKSRLVYDSNTLYLERNDDLNVTIEEKSKYGDMNDLIRPFKLLNNNLYKVILVKNKDKTFLFLDFNNIIFDEASIDTFIKTFSNYYHSFRNVSQMNTDIFLHHEEKFKSNDDFYDNMLKNINEATEPFNISKISKEKANRQVFKINKKRVDDFAKKYDTNPNIVFLSSYLHILNILSLKDTNDPIISITINNRPNTLDKQVGMFVNTLPFNIEINNNDTIDEYIKNVENKYSELLENPNYSLSQMNSKYKFIPTVHYIFSENLFNKDDIELKGLKNIILPKINQEREIFSFSLQIKTGKDNYILQYEYDKNKYSKEYIKMFNNSLICFLINNDSSNKLNEIYILPKKEKELILNKYNGSLDLDLLNEVRNNTIVSLFEKQVNLNPNNVAIVYEDKKLTYKELNEEANLLANYLLDNYQVKNDDLIALKLNRSTNMIVAILGVLKSGAAYVPISPDYPQKRIEFIIKDAQTKILLDDSKVDEILIKSNNTNDPEKIIVVNNLAYVIYTSGTTGQPKGVMIEHKSLVSLYYATKKNFDFNDNDIWTQFHSYNFDFSVWEIFISLFTGAKLIIVPNNARKDIFEFINLVKKENITVLNQTPQIFYEFIKANNEEINKIRYVIFGGERIDVTKLSPWINNKVELINMYGITETTIHATYYKINRISNKSIIGKGLSNLKLYILNTNHNLLPMNAIGELYIGGLGVSRGYLNNEKLTSERFLPNPFQTDEQKILGVNDRIYKTGDLVRYLPNGDIEYIGRNDFQV
ncbi:MAG: amino acid adenylation domain-containing protein, partial [Methanobrevibacter sp.]|nr:amino acid adenylation domain-containing protein [Methanobrevibacter sp.]